MSIIATVTNCIQVGQNSFRDNHVSKVFSESSEIGEILSWAKEALGVKAISICDIQFSEISE